MLKTVLGDEAEILQERDFQVLMLANMLAPLSTSLLSPILDSLIDPFGASTANIGLLISAVTAPAIITIPVAGLLADRLGRKPILVVSLFLYSIFGVAIAFTTNFTIVLILRSLQGVAFGGLTPVIITALGDVYAGATEATAQGVRFAGSGLVQTGFPLLAGGLLLFSWRFPFLIYAIGVPISVIVALWFKDPTHDTDQSGQQRDDSGGEPKFKLIWKLICTPRNASLIIARGLPIMIWIGFITYNSIIVVRLLDGTPTQAGVLVAIASIAYAAGATQAGRVTTVFKTRFYPLIGTNVCLGAGFAIFLFAPVLVLAGVGVIIMGFGFGLSLSLYRSIITGLAGEALRGSIVSVAESFSRLIATITPVAIGLVIGFLEQTMGLRSAVQFAGLSIGAISVFGGLLCLVSARLSASSPRSTRLQ